MSEIIKNKSWKTTAFGVATILSAVASATQAMLDNDPSTNVDMNLLIIAITSGLGLIKARDNDKSSEQVGAK